MSTKPEPQLDEHDLVARVRRHDPTAFMGLVDLYQAPVFNLCYRMLGDQHEAEDAAQETFLRAYRHFNSYDARRAFKTWLFSIANHYCIDRLRRRHWLFVSSDADLVQQHPALREPAPGPEASALMREQAAAVHELLQALSFRDRQVVVLRYWHELSYAEIAGIVGDSVCAVKSRLHRAREHMARIIGGEASLAVTLAAA